MCSVLAIEQTFVSCVIRHCLVGRPNLYGGSLVPDSFVKESHLFIVTLFVDDVVRDLSLTGRWFDFYSCLPGFNGCRHFYYINTSRNVKNEDFINPNSIADVID